MSDWVCENHRFFTVVWVFNNGDPYPYLNCEECDMMYGWDQPCDWPEVPMVADIYVVGVPHV